MTIAKGQPWGSPAPLPPSGIVVATDAEAGQAVEQARRRGLPLPALGLVGGDLCRTLGGTGDRARLRSAEAVSFPVDVGCAVLDGVEHWFVAHLVAHDRPRRGWWLAMNGQWLGRLNVAPRAHPDDAVLDTFDATLGPRELWKVRARARHGAHLPHPAVAERRVRRAEVTFPRPRAVWLDGVRVARARHVVVGIEADAATVVI